MKNNGSMNYVPSMDSMRWKVSSICWSV